MPTIKFKLKDPKYCNGCPCWGHENGQYFCNYYTDAMIMPITLTMKNKKLIRIQSCIDKFGE
jgi:hypothetical protein